MQRVALLGLGTMGAGMASNWLKKGFSVSLYNRTRAKAGPFAALGASIASTPREAAAGADVIVAMVADDRASREVWLGADGALPAAAHGAIVIESSTLTPDWTRELAGEAERRGCRFLDAPVGGSKGAAADGKLVFFVGGAPATLEAARPTLEAVGGRITHLGPAGAGASWKLINNMLIGAQLSALAEALKLADRAGFEAAQAAALISAGAAASPVVQMKLTRMLERNFSSPDFALHLMHKDLRYVVGLAEKLGLRLDIGEGAAAAFARADKNGLGDLDVAAIAE